MWWQPPSAAPWCVVEHPSVHGCVGWAPWGVVLLAPAANAEPGTGHRAAAGAAAAQPDGPAPRRRWRLQNAKLARPQLGATSAAGARWRLRNAPWRPLACEASLGAAAMTTTMAMATARAATAPSWANLGSNIRARCRPAAKPTASPTPNAAAASPACPPPASKPAALRQPALAKLLMEAGNVSDGGSDSETHDAWSESEIHDAWSDTQGPLEDQLDDDEDCCGCDGAWAGRGTISSGMLRWQDGPAVALSVTGAATVEVALGGATYRGELRADGKLHWDDGDVWARESRFDGLWAGRGLIEGDTLTWSDGPAVPLVLTSSTTLELAFDGRTYCGVLQEDGRLHWDDGDIWVRHALRAGDAIKARLGTAFSDSGVDVFAAGDEGKVMQAGDGSPGRASLDIWWPRTRQSSTYPFASWTCAFEPAPRRLCFGFRLFSRVRFAGIPSETRRSGVRQGEVGTVVGFTDGGVEVQFQVRVLQCRPVELQEADPVPGPRPRPPVPQPERSVAPAPAGAADERRYRGTMADPVPALQPPPPRLELSVAPAPAGTADARRYRGTVTWSRGAFAWVTCEALAARFPGCDIRLHKNDCATKPPQWGHASFQVSFQLTVDDRGHPKAVRAMVETAQPAAAPDMVSARDWFSERAKARAWAPSPREP